MQKFTIRDIENMCGIKAHTLRIWEQRYQLATPKRKESLHRFYDNEDLKAWLRISFLYHNGWKISKIAALSAQKILEQVRNEKTVSDNYSAFVTLLLEAAIDFDEKQFNNVIDELIEKIGFEKCITKVCYPFLQKTGLLWMTHNVIPAQEHFSSYLIQHKIISETDKLSLNSSGDTIILFTPDGEHHELPLLFINYLLKKNGWKPIYFGSNVKWQNLKEVVDKQEIKTLFLHLITNFTRFEIDDYLESLSKAFPKKKIAASGAAIQSAQRNFLNVQLLKTDEAVYHFIQNTTSATHKL